MPILNPSFEDAGTLPGEAAHWTLTAMTSLEEMAGFGALPEQAWEDFERWFELRAELEAVLTARAFFAPGTDGFESFLFDDGSQVPQPCQRLGPLNPLAFEQGQVLFKTDWIYFRIIQSFYFFRKLRTLFFGT